VSVKYNSAYAISQSRKLLILRSPPVRTSKSSGGIPASESPLANCCSSISSGCTSPAATRLLTCRAASTMSQRPPKATANARSIRLFPAVCASATASFFCKRLDNWSRAPTKRTRISFLCNTSTSRCSTSRNRLIRLLTSSSGRLQFSLLKANSVSASIPHCAADSTISRVALTPARCPECLGLPCAFAQRPFPSIMMAT